MSPACDMCGRGKLPNEPEYNPIDLMTGRTTGWYSGDDGEICGSCMVKLYRKANNI